MNPVLIITTLIVILINYFFFFKSSDAIFIFTTAYYIFGIFTYHICKDLSINDSKSELSPQCQPNVTVTEDKGTADSINLEKEHISCSRDSGLVAESYGNDTMLAKTRNWKIFKEFIKQVGDPCTQPKAITAGSAVISVASMLFIVVYALLPMDNYSAYGNTMGVYWKMEATGENYDTIALKKEVTEGIYKAVEATGEDGQLELCEAACLYMENGETYTAYGAIGACSEAVAAIKCNADTKCGSCIKGNAPKKRLN